MAKIVIIIPTYNEAKSTPKMVEALSEILHQIKKHDIHVLYVDDTSPDGTADIVKTLQKKHKWLHLLVNPTKGGLGLAYAKGMEYAMEKLKAEWIMEFDADFQHPPKDIPRLIAQIDNGYDYVVGSRYIPGGSIPKSWGFQRKFLSVIGNLVARVLLILPSIHDVTGGFKLSRVKGFLDEFNFSTLLSKSFAYKIHLFFYMVKKGAKVKEVPFAFSSRTEGESKIIKNEMQETLRVIFMLQYQNPSMRKLFKFGTVGFTGFVINFILLRVLRNVGLAERIAWILSTEVAIISNFALNNLWTFKQSKISGIGHTISKFLQFNVSSVGALAIQGIFGPIGVALIGEQWDFLVLAFIVAFMVLPYNYFMYNVFIWKTWKIPGLSRIQKMLG